MLFAYPRAYILFIIFSKYVLFCLVPILGLIFPRGLCLSGHVKEKAWEGAVQGLGVTLGNVLLIAHVFIEKHIACLHHYVPFDYRIVKTLRTPRSKLVNKFWHTKVQMTRYCTVLVLCVSRITNIGRYTSWLISEEEFQAGNVNGKHCTLKGTILLHPGCRTCLILAFFLSEEENAKVEQGKEGLC